MIFPFAEKAIEVTAPVCPDKGRVWLFASRSQSRTVLLVLPITRILLPGTKANDRTALLSLITGPGEELPVLTSHNHTVLSAPPVASQLPSVEKARDNTRCVWWLRKVLSLSLVLPICHSVTSESPVATASICFFEKATGVTTPSPGVGGSS